MRIFVAIDIPMDQKIRIKELIQSMKELQNQNINYVNPDNLHITLKFIGEWEESRLNQLTQVIKPLDTGPFDICLQKTGAFPNLVFPSVLWVGIESSKRLARLNELIEQKTLELGIKGEGREFNPHLTIARIKGNIQPELKKLMLSKGNESFGSFTVNQYHIYQSILMPSGPEYRILEMFSLAGGLDE